MSSSTTPRRRPDWLEQVWMEVQAEIDYETEHPQPTNDVYIDAWKLYCEAYRELWPKAPKVPDKVSQAALQQMVDKMLATGGVIYRAMERVSAQSGKTR